MVIILIKIGILITLKRDEIKQLVKDEIASSMMSSKNGMLKNSSTVSHKKTLLRQVKMAHLLGTFFKLLCPNEYFCHHVVVC